MFLRHTVFCNIRAAWYKDCLICLLSFLLLIFFFRYSENYHANVSQLEDIGKTISVNGWVSNSNRSERRSLQIENKKVKELRSSGFITKEIVTFNAYAQPTATNETEEEFPPLLLGTNSLSSVFGEHEYFELSECVTEGEAIFATAQPVCIVSQEAALHFGLAMGDEVEVMVSVPEYDENGRQTLQSVPIGTVNLTIMGTYTLANRNRLNNYSFICPADFLSGYVEENTKGCYASSFEFTVSNPQQLNQFKEYLHELGFLSPNYSAANNSKGTTVAINDEAFILPASQIQDNMNVLTALLPLLLAVMGLVAFTANYFLVASKRKELAIMRGLGVSRSKCVQIYFLEILLSIAVGLLCAAVFLFCQNSFFVVPSYVAAGVFVSTGIVCSAGGIAATVLISRESSLVLLNKDS